MKFTPSYESLIISVLHSPLSDELITSIPGSSGSGSDSGYCSKNLPTNGTPYPHFKLLSPSSEQVLYNPSNISCPDKFGLNALQHINRLAQFGEHLLVYATSSQPLSHSVFVRFGIINTGFVGTVKSDHPNVFPTDITSGISFGINKLLVIELPAAINTGISGIDFTKSCIFTKYSFISSGWSGNPHATDPFIQSTFNSFPHNIA